LVVQKLITPAQFGAKFDPPKSANHIKRLCREERIKGAVRPGHEWLIPERARVVGKGKRLEYGEVKGLSAIQFARLHGRTHQRAYQLLNKGRVEGAKKTKHGWDIPKDAPWPADDGL